MGRSYWFECSRCGYKATVSGRADRGLNFFIQTILCADCKQLYDAVTQLKVPDERPLDSQMNRFGWVSRYGVQPGTFRRDSPPPFSKALSLLQYRGVRRFKWLKFPAQCPVSPLHRTKNWNDPGKCPRCGVHLDKNVLPFRIWD